MAHLLFVCEGNICRSPFAERVVRAALPSTGANRVTVASAGLHPLLEAQISKETGALIEELGGSVRGHRPRRLRRRDLEDATLVLTATRVQRAQVVQLHPRAVQYTYTIRQFGNALAATFPEGLPVPPADSSTEQRLGAVQELFRDSQGSVGSDPENEDVVDPYAKPARVHAQAASEMLPALSLLVQGLGAPPLVIPQSLLPEPTRRPSRLPWR